MAAYVALLRGINVAGQSRVGMKDLQALFAGLGHTAVTTYLQSGNVVFTPADGVDLAGIVADLEAHLAADLGVAASVLLRGGAELGQIRSANPYLDDEDDPAKLHVTFLATPPTAERAARLEVPAGETARCSLAGREVYLHCPDGYGRTKLNNAFVERRLAVTATTRNWKSVTALHQLATG